MSARVSKPASGRGQARRAAAAAVFMAACLSLAAQAAAPGGVYLSPSHRIATLDTGIAPELYGSTVILAHRTAAPTRYVALRFRDDPTLHVYGRITRRSTTPGGAGTFTIFVLALDLSTVSLPPDGRLLYRVTIDGLWMPDPDNPARTFDQATRLDWSVIEVNPRDIKPPGSPEWMPDGLVRFRYLGDPGRRVALVADFNRWDPYMHVLAEDTPGEYTIDLRLPPGPHSYVFLVDGERTTDQLNPRRAVDSWGRAVCLVSAEPAGDALSLAARPCVPAPFCRASVGQVDRRNAKTYNPCEPPMSLNAAEYGGPAPEARTESL